MWRCQVSPINYLSPQPPKSTKKLASNPRHHQGHPPYTIPSEQESPPPRFQTKNPPPRPKPTPNKQTLGNKPMMASLQAGTEKDVEKEKEKMKSSLGGGEFCKIDKI